MDLYDELILQFYMWKKLTRCSFWFSLSHIFLWFLLINGFVLIDVGKIISCSCIFPRIIQFNSRFFNINNEIQSILAFSGLDCCWWRTWGEDEEEQKKLVSVVHRYIQWSCNLMTEIISKILSIKKLTEYTKLTNGGVYEGPNRNFLEL